MEFGLSHVVIAIVAFMFGSMVRRKPALPVGDTRTADMTTLSLGARLFQIAFVGAWLVGWTVGLFFGGAFFLTTLSAPSLMTVFLGAWTLAAAVALVYVGWQWVRMILGHPDAFRRRH